VIIGFLLHPARAVDDAWLLPTQHAFVALQLRPADRIDALERLSVDVRFVAHYVLPCWERSGSLAILAAVVFVLDDVFGLLHLLGGRWIFGDLGKVVVFLFELDAVVLLVAGVGHHHFGLAVSRQHQLPGQSLLLRHRLPASLLQLLHSIRVTESVQRVFAAARPRGDVADHQRLAEASEGVLEHHRQFAASKGRVVFSLVQRPDALLEGQQALIDLRAVDLGLLVLVDCVGAPLAAGQIDETDLSRRLLAQPQLDLEDGVRARRIGIGAILAGDSHARAIGNDLHEFARSGHSFGGEADDVDVLLGVLPRLQQLALVEQVEQLPAVDLVEGDEDLDVRVVLVPNREDVLAAQVVHSQNSALCVAVHRVGLA